ncbi:amino acid adenylation domain-containing protein [Streptomyces sp. NBC_00237]|uniref:amino acid adenylation domain-containing protein n=1 Tax=Streptomyces sp. NBC_00237 TaxID=2975687 RepID=UPI002254C2A1|nr:amino acid adenylation domain-containing protein [Streptomyces sp. NBC_00237]MCX5205673.1 amino acid adenylation domain-containing protein [Streptomyces sp. NBC_00237]
MTDILESSEVIPGISLAERDTTLWQLLCERAEELPGAMAVIDSSQTLTYAQLVAEASTLARCLRAGGIGPGDSVACAVPRGVRAVVAQLAVFAAEAVYVPVSADDPPDRLRALLDGVAARRVLTLSCQRLPDGVDRIDMDAPMQPPGGAGLAKSGRLPGPSPEMRAYIIHTSGTSGRPKPVAVTHRAIAHTMRAHARRFAEPVRCMAVVSPMTTDASLPGIWWPLLAGGTVWLAPTDAQQTVNDLAAQLGSGQVSHVLLTPSLYGAVLPLLEGPSPHLRQVVVGGEPCPSELAADHHRRMPGVELVNAYGPTEAAVWCTAAVLRPGEPVTAGTALPGTPVLVIGANGQPVPAGETGEVCVAGAGLAQGYAADTELTASRFVALPSDGRRRMYRTGDLGRFDGHGRLELLGRKDAQVKVRGFRVEPEGVGRVLQDMPGVRDATVGVHEGRLVAHVVPRWDEQSAARQLHETWDELFSSLDFRDERAGWTSSYTGAQLPDAEMDEWIDATVRLATETGRPSSLLDLGCGSGMILTRLAGTAARVVGVDVSAESLAAVRARLDAMGLSGVELRQGDVTSARDVTGMDLVLCNSVVPYLHSAAHLERAVAGALGAVAPGGRVVFGDVKDRTVQDAFHASVVLDGADDGEGVEVLRTRWRRRVACDPYLLVDPRWFTRCGVPYAEVRPRTGLARNEMNDFRFDAVLVPRAPGGVVEVEQWHSWPKSLEGMRELLEAEPGPVGVLRVPNRRTAGACAVRDVLAAGNGGFTAADLRALAARAEADAVHPVALEELAADMGRPVRLSRAAGYRDGAFDVVFLPAVPHGADNGGERAVAIRWPQLACADDLVSAPLHRHVLARASEELLPALRRHAERSLPEHERPSRYVLLAELPLGANGKLDRAALPAPSTERPAMSTPYRAPQSPVEETLTGILANVLELDRVGMDDDFVELGGDSLRAVRAATQIGAAVGRDVPSRSVLEHPTAARLSAYLADTAKGVPGQRAASTADVLTDIGPDGVRLAAGPTHQFLRVNDDRAGGILPSHGPRFSLECHYRIHGPLDVRALSTAVDRLVAHQPALRTAVQLTGEPGELHQTVHPAPEGVLRHHSAEALGSRSPSQFLAVLDAADPLDAAAGHVFTATLLTAGPHDHLLGLRLHHLTSDGWSLNLVEQQLSTLYADAVAGRTSTLPATDYQALNAPEEPRADDLAFWTRRLDSARPGLLIPPAHLRAHTDVHDALLRTRRIPAATATAFRELARTERVTPASALYALFAALVAADTGQDETLLLAVSAAHPGDTAHTAGLYAQAVPVRHHVSREPALTVRQALRSADTDLQQALRHDSASLLTLAGIHPPIGELFAASQFVFYDYLPPVEGLRLTGCAVERTDQLDPAFTGQLFQLPCDLGLLARESGDALDLAVIFDPAYAPPHYAENLLARLADALDTLAESAADRPWKGLVPADSWLAGLH